MANDNKKFGVCEADKIIGANVAAHRIKNGLTEIYVASCLDMAVDNYLDAETGDYPLTIVDIIHLARLFAVEVTDLMPSSN